MSENLFEILHQAFTPRLDAIFLRPASGAPRSYREVTARSAAFAAALRAAGVTAGDRVSVQIEKSPDAVALYLACLRIGAVHLPLNVAYTAAELRHALEDAEPRIHVGRPQDATRAAGMVEEHAGLKILTLGDREEGTLVEKAARLPPYEDVIPRAGSDLAALLYTSGTTGRPKGAMITHENLATNARALFQTWAWRPDDVLLHALPIFHVHGLFVALHCAMLGGSPVEFLPRFDPETVRAALPRATVMMGVPTFYRRLLATPGFDRESCRHVRLFISGSAPLPEAIFRAFAERTGHAVLERYGMTETGILTSNPVDGARIEGTVGHRLPDVDLRVRNADGSTSAPGEVGGVEVRGRGVFAGYWKRPETTRESFDEEGFFRTGDLGSLSADGRLTLAGRSSDLIISGGYNVYPKEIELHLDEIPGVGESAVVGLPHPDFGEAVTAFIVAEDGAAPTADEIRAALRERLAGFKHPRRVFLVDALPRNAMGKVQKSLLRDRHADAYAVEEA